MCGIFTQIWDCGQQGSSTVHWAWKKKKEVVYGPNADVKGIVVLIYGGPVARLWCIAEVRHFTLWWILLVVGPDQFCRHFRGCCMPGPQPRRLPRRIQTIIYRNTSFFFFFFFLLVTLQPQAKHSNIFHKGQRGKRTFFFFLLRWNMKEENNKSTWKIHDLKKVGDEPKKKKSQWISQGQLGFQFQWMWRLMAIWSMYARNNKKNKERKSLQLATWLSLYCLLFNSHPTFIPALSLERKQMCWYAWCFAWAQDAMEEPWCVVHHRDRAGDAHHKSK